MAAIPPVLNGFRLFTGDLLNLIINVCNNLTGNGTPQAITASSLTNSGATTFGTGPFKIPPQIVTTAGTTQLGATAITSTTAIITVNTTSSLHGVRLPTAATGLQIWIANAATTFAFKIYPATNGKIGAAATNATDTALAKNKANQYIALNTTYWAVQRGA